MKELYLAGGCFWGMQRYFDCVAGVINTQVGFVNGNISHPSYMEVCTGMTGFAEAVRVEYDEEDLPLQGVLELYLKALDPDDESRYGEEVKSQYRNGIYYVDMDDREEILVYLKRLRENGERLPMVEVGALKNYYMAEEYHQHYLEKHPTGYCEIGREAFTYAGEYRV